METKHVKEVVADPSILGLFGLAMVTLVASSQKLGITDGLSFIIPWALFLGGMAQIIAGYFDFKHNNLFGATAFSAYGLFWIAVGATWLLKLGVFGETLQRTADGRQLGLAFFGYFLLSVPLAISALKMSVTMFVLMADICLLFLALGLNAVGFGEFWHSVAAFSEFTISLVTFYALTAKYLLGFFGKSIIPLGAPLLK